MVTGSRELLFLCVKTPSSIESALFLWPALLKGLRLPALATPSTRLFILPQLANQYAPRASHSPWVFTSSLANQILPWDFPLRDKASVSL